MPATHRKNLLARRRRRQDDGEEDQSVVDDLEPDSMSEGSALSTVEDDDDEDEDDAEGEASNSSGDENEVAKPPSVAGKDPGHEVEKGLERNLPASGSLEPQAPLEQGADALVNRPGVAAGAKVQRADELRSEALGATDESAPPTNTEFVAPKAPRHEDASQRSRREHQEYVRQRNANPAFVPTRGGFFLHDDRHSRSSGQNQKTFGRGRGRESGVPMHAGRGMNSNEPTNRPWAHDLHEDHEMAPKREQPHSKTVPRSDNQQAQRAPTSTAPNRSFSFSAVLGNVTVQVSFPGMDQKISIPNAVKKQHTLLPQHRPPLRRDKPVRVSIPDTAPRYIFPSAERSFIFIPRALRPNQHTYRGRGRDSFQGSRRPSVYGSAYTPSVAMSRKSSLGGSATRDAVRSPADSVMSRNAFPGVEGTRPVVRLPSTVPTPSLSAGGMPLVNGQLGMVAQEAQVQPPAMYANHANSIPIHQPRPQKAVSVADIESPASFQFRAPQPQEEQPFHQQVPTHITNPYTDEKPTQSGHQTVSSMTGVAPLSQIPEGAVFAPGFQPYPVMGGPAYFATPYSTGPVFYPPMGDASSFAVPMNAPSLAPSFVPGSHSHPIAYVPGAGGLEGSLPLAHESNGMVYYYNPPMLGPEGQGGLQTMPGAANGPTMPIANGMPGQTAFYYTSAPNGMFYPSQSG
ncbi:hypothetical protein ABEF93_007189 [Exophiala dermatitidis]